MLCYGVYQGSMDLFKLLFRQRCSMVWHTATERSAWRTCVQGGKVWLKLLFHFSRCSMPWRAAFDYRSASHSAVWFGYNYRSAIHCVVWCGMVWRTASGQSFRHSECCMAWSQPLFRHPLWSMMWHVASGQSIWHTCCGGSVLTWR